MATAKQPATTHRYRWTSADLGTPRVDLEDKEALRRVLDQRT